MTLRTSSFAFIVSASSLMLVASAMLNASCSSDKRPDAGSTDSDGGFAPEITPTPEGGAGDGGEDGGDAGLPESCINTIRDDQETDVDCGGAICSKCIDGKSCIADTDCVGGACIDKVCQTPNCTDKVKDGDETDTDCGGTTCAKCTIGKTCKAGTDCVSGACNSLNACACPPGMTTVSREGGDGAYCVDEIEVTKFQYNKFITANVPITDQIAVCKPPVNENFVPRGAWPPATAPPYINSPNVGHAFNYSLPVHYVDWCDAYAYCKWANKQLCGSITGGPVAYAMADSPDAGAWYNACSAQGQKPWPYGTIYDQQKCNGGKGLLLDPDAGGPVPQFTGYGFPGSNQDLGIHQLVNGDINGKYTLIEFAACQGGATGLYQMSGNVAEWENACDGDQANSNCRVRGGSYKANFDQNVLRCDANRTVQRVPPDPGAGNPDPLEDVGFRCCLY